MSLVQVNELASAGSRPSLRYRSINAALAAEVRDFLSRQQRALPSRFLYDPMISGLRRQVQTIDAMHHATVERPLLPAALASVSAMRAIVELAPSSNTLPVVDAMARHDALQAFVAVELAEGPADESAQRIHARHPHLAASVAVAEVEVSFRIPRYMARPALFVALGGTFNRFTPVPAARFLRNVRATMQPDDRLILGLDLRTGLALEAHELAHSDLREAWHRHALVVVNRDLQATFEPERFQYRPQYDPSNRRLDLLLEATGRCRVTSPGFEPMVFKAGDRIRTGVLCQYDRTAFTALLRGVGLTLECWVETTHGPASHAIAVVAPLVSDVGA